jgi:hypothetical protein
MDVEDGELAEMIGENRHETSSDRATMWNDAVDKVMTGNVWALVRES